MNIATVASMTNAEYQILIVSMVKGETLMSGQDCAIHDLSAELLPKSVLRGYAQSGNRHRYRHLSIDLLGLDWTDLDE